jgi:hypothetical protein
MICSTRLDYFALIPGLVVPVAVPELERFDRRKNREKMRVASPRISSSWRVLVELTSDRSQTGGENANRSVGPRN